MESSVSEDKTMAEKPIIEITSCPIATTIEKMVIAGTIHSELPNLQLFINSEEQKILNGKFMASMPLESGANEFDIVLVDDTHTIAREKRAIFCGFLPPVLRVDDMPDVTAAPEITLSGQALDVNQHKSILTLKINSEVIPIEEDGKWSKTFALKQGSNHFDLLLYDGALRKTIIRKQLEHHPQAPEIVFSGLGPTVASRNLEFVGTLSNFDQNRTDIRIHGKVVPVVDGCFRYKTSIRTDKTEIPISVDFNGRMILDFERQVTFVPSPPTVTIDDEVKQLSANQCRISGQISDENDSAPTLSVNEKEIAVHSGAWSANLTLKSGINTIIIEARNHNGLKKVIKKQIIAQ
jgi:hypothetical protein